MIKLQRCIPWTSLRNIGNSTPVRLTIIIPIIGYLIIFNEYFLSYIELSRELFGKGSLVSNSGSASVPLRLLLVYFGLCLVACASVLYSWRCPPVIKKYASSPEFIGGDGRNISLIELYRIADWIKSRESVDDVFGDLLSSFDYNVTHGDKSADEVRRENVEGEANGLHQYFELLNFQEPWMRISTAAIYALGIFFLAVPSLEVFIKVLAAIVREVWR